MCMFDPPSPFILHVPRPIMSATRPGSNLLSSSNAPTCTAYHSIPQHSAARRVSHTLCHSISAAETIDCQTLLHFPSPTPSRTAVAWKLCWQGHNTPAVAAAAAPTLSHRCLGIECSSCTLPRSVACALQQQQEQHPPTHTHTGTQQPAGEFSSADASPCCCVALLCCPAVLSRQACKPATAAAVHVLFCFCL